MPDWAKDKEGHWALAYTGSIAFIIDKQQVKEIPHSWADLLKGNYVVTIGDVNSASQAVSGVLAANVALGGDEKNLKPALEFFGKLAKAGRLSVTDPVISGYTTIINKYAKNPNAAKLAREYIFSDVGQINLARGYARPIRAQHITLPRQWQEHVIINMKQ